MLATRGSYCVRLTFSISASYNLFPSRPSLDTLCSARNCARCWSSSSLNGTRACFPSWVDGAYMSLRGENDSGSSSGCFVWYRRIFLSNQSLSLA